MASLQCLCCTSVPCHQHWTIIPTATSDGPIREKRHPKHLLEQEEAADDCKGLWQSHKVLGQSAAAPCFFHSKTQQTHQSSMWSVVHDHLPNPELLLGGKMQHILPPAPTKGPLGICIGFSAPSSALWGFGSSFIVGYEPKDKVSGKGWLESSGHGQSQLLCLHWCGGDQKMLVLRKC